MDRRSSHGKLTWDVTDTDTLGVVSTCPVINLKSHRRAAEGAADRKELKYRSLAHTHTFIPMAFETLRPINSKGTDFFNQLGRHQLALATCEKLRSYFQRLSLIIQRFKQLLISMFLKADLNS